MGNENPYVAPMMNEPVVPLPAGRSKSVFAYWLLLTIGIGFSGVAFGIIAGPIGMFVGGLIAFPVAAIVTLSVVTVVAVLRRNRISFSGAIIMGAFCGFASGFMSVVVLGQGDLTNGAEMACAAGCVSLLEDAFGADLREVA